jgi:cysteine desulfurase
MALKFPIFMDNHSTTPVDPRVLEEMLPYFTTKFGNAASRNHPFGWEAEEAVDYARERIAKLIGAKDSKEIVLTSGATESDNLALKGVAEFYKDKGNHIITTVTEHKAILDTCKRLEKEGCEVTYLPVDKDGLVDPDDVKKAITDKTILVSVMLANNEIGTVQPLEAIGKVTRERGVLLHTDAVQGVGKVDFDVQTMNVDLASITSHKMYGPKGVGALYVRRSKPRVRLVAQMDGGGHERGMRSGTLAVPLIVGFGKAAEIMFKDGKDESVKLSALRERLRSSIMSRLDEVYINGSVEHRLPGNLNISFNFVEGEGLMMAMKDVAVSSGSACTSASLEPSYVLRALGVGDELAHSSIRFGLGRFNTEEEVDYVANLVVAKVKGLRELSPLWEMHKEGIDLKSIQWAAH